MKDEDPASDGKGIYAYNNTVAAANLFVASDGNWPLTVSGTVINANPKICGGSNIYTPNYFALQAGSPALGAGSNVLASTVPRVAWIRYCQYVVMSMSSRDGFEKYPSSIDGHRL